jgi:large subunit ribosomal protein L23
MSLFSKKPKIEEKKAEKALPKAEAKAAPKSAVHGMGVKSVLEQPWFSERATVLAAKGQYVFLVKPGATKPAVREEIERRYGVTVLGVNTVTLKGKMKHYGHKMGRRSGIKKAIVTLKVGDKIEIQ